jgi:hypothetical protein
MSERTQLTKAGALFEKTLKRKGDRPRADKDRNQPGSTSKLLNNPHELLHWQTFEFRVELARAVERSDLVSRSHQPAKKAIRDQQAQVTRADRDQNL